MKSLRPKDRLAFYRHVYEMVDSGLTTVDAVGNFVTDSKSLKAATQRILAEMRKGVGFAEALKRAGLSVPLERATLSAGEKSGNLLSALESIVHGLEESEEFMTNLRQSLMMPIVNVLAAVGAVFYLAMSVLPKVGKSFKSLGGLPPLSIKIFALAELFNNYWFMVVVAMAGVVAGLVYVWVTKPAFLYSVPLFGEILNYLFLSVLFGGLHMSQRAGYSVLEGLIEIEMSLIGHTKQKVKDIISEMRGGHHFDVALSKNPAVFPRDIVGMISTARAAGNYDRIIPSAAKLCRSRSYKLAKRIATIMEPVVLIVVGAAVLVMAMSIYYPIATVGTEFGPNGR